jgi:hypothetical protein
MTGSTLIRPETGGATARPRRWPMALMAAILAAVTNALIHLSGVAAGVYEAVWMAGASKGQMTLEPVLLVSVVATLAGVSVYGALARRARNPLRTFAWIAGVLLVASFAAPFLVPGATLAQAILSNVQHVVVAALVLAVAVRHQRQPGAVPPVV